VSHNKKIVFYSKIYWFVCFQENVCEATDTKIEKEVVAKQCKNEHRLQKLKHLH
jgi:hypothetical protein